MDLPWNSLDATAFSWQKGLGGEAGVGVLVLGPRALERLQKTEASQGVPFLLNIRQGPHLAMDLFQGKTLNTLSMLALEDARWCHRWALEQGGIKALTRRSADHLFHMGAWLNNHPYLQFLGKNKNTLSSSTMCFSFKNKTWNRWEIYEKIASRLAHKQVAFDCLNHRGAAPAFRLWGGPTIELSDLQALLPWIDQEIKNVIQP
jgi:phosphoserine aminotransferase